MKVGQLADQEEYFSSKIMQNIYRKTTSRTLFVFKKPL